jgi:hypothetical protein
MSTTEILQLIKISDYIQMFVRLGYVFYREGYIDKC